MRFILSGNLITLAGYQREVESAGSTLGECVRHLVDAHPRLAPVLLDASGNIRNVLRVFLNGEQLTALGADRPIDARDEVVLLTAIAGG
jgi:molybdopterin converting factor small subunit